MSVKMGWFHVVFISLCVFKGTWPFQWTSRTDGAVMRICRGRDLHLPLTYSLSDGQQVADIQWYFKGQSEEMVAMVNSHGQFVPMPSFANRVEFVPPAGLVVKNVVPSDSGNYTVEVTSLTGFPRQHFTTVVDVQDPPSSDHDVLTVTQERSAVYNNNTGHWAIGLTCGKFSSLGHPPVDVVWTTPTGEKKASTGFRNGSFLLTLDNPPTAGTYSCSISHSSVAALCLSPSSGLLHHADVILDEGLANLTLKEHKQEAEITRLRHEVQQLKQNLTTYIQTCDGHTQSVSAVPCAGGNHYVLNDAWRDVHHGFNKSCDDRLDAGWYRFRLHGNNAVMPTSCVPWDHCGTAGAIWLELGGRPLPDLGQKTTGMAYGSVESNTTNTPSCHAYQKTPVTVLNCGTFYLYHLQPANNCPMAYCADLPD